MESQHTENFISQTRRHGLNVNIPKLYFLKDKYLKSTSVVTVNFIEVLIRKISMNKFELRDEKEKKLMLMGDTGRVVDQYAALSKKNKCKPNLNPHTHFFK